MTTEEWKNLIRDLKRKQKYHWLRTCVLGYIVDNARHIHTDEPFKDFISRYTYNIVVVWCTNASNFGTYKKVLLSKS